MFYNLSGLERINNEVNVLEKWQMVGYSTFINKITWICSFLPYA